jgi:hypothetical protein
MEHGKQGRSDNCKVGTLVVSRRSKQRLTASSRLVFQSIKSMVQVSEYPFADMSLGHSALAGDGRQRETFSQEEEDKSPSSQACAYRG